jgi:class 3 adenylate cyclase/alpha-beta hydrolase superfamily lysophospholipase
MDIPDTKYAKTADGVHIAYQVVGDGPLDLITVWGTMSQVEVMWEDPRLARFLERLASFSRFIHFDKRGTGLSDRGPGAPTLEERMDDIRAVMDAVSSDRAVVFGESEGGPMCSLFAATYPERTVALVLYGALVKAVRDETFRWALPAERFEQLIEDWAANWGSGKRSETFAPSVPETEANTAWMARLERQALSPGAFRDLYRTLAQIDIRPVLPTIAVPTLVLHRAGDRAVNVMHGRYLAEHIPGAKYVELEGDHYLGSGDSDAIADEIQEFLTGVRPVAEPDRMLSTVFFSDLVGSTAKASELGDRRWTALLDQHDALVRRQLERHGGRYINSTGDGLLATFDGPARAIRCAQAICDGGRALGIEIRAGLHTGEVEIRGDDIGGIAVHIGQRVSGLAGPGEVLVSSTVKDLVAGSGIAFSDRGTHALKGVPDEWRLFAAEP